MLSSSMRDILLEHMDGQAVPILRVSELSGLDAKLAADRHHTTKGLLLRGFLKYSGSRTLAPTHTFITEAGRRELCALLGEYADVLVRAKWQLPPTSGDLTPTPAFVARRNADKATESVGDPR